MESQFISGANVYTPNKLFDGHYRLIRRLNDNRAAVAIWLARDLNTIDKNASANAESSGLLVSIMIFHPSTSLDIEEEQRWQDEFDAAHDCPHPNLLPPEEYTIFDDTYYLVFPYAETDSLSQSIGKNMSDKTTWKLISDIASGLNALHTHEPQVIHSDIKPSNIFVFDNETFVLTNFGIHFETDSQQIDSHNDSLAYMAPERFQDASAPQPESDIWAFGATLYEVLTGSKPFGECGGKNQRHDTPMPPLPDQPAEIRDLVYACLQANPQMRPTAQQIKKAAHSKKFLAKQNKKKQPKRASNPSANENRKKRSVAIVAAALLLLGILFFVLMPHHHEEVPQKEVVKQVNYYEKATNLLLDKNTATAGLELLDSLVAKKDWQATFLMSRLYFDTRERDTAFYDKQWKIMRENCGIIPDNKMAHKYLLDASELNENDFMIFYQLGCDYKAGHIRKSCERNLNNSLWCFNAAQEILNSTDSNNEQYRKALELMFEGIPDSISPIKPSR